jgi:hypothetical protein
VNPSPPAAILQSAPEAWQAWAAFAPLIAAVIAGLIALAALRQRRRADNQSEWWRRAQWGLDAAFDPRPERRAMGLAVLEVLSGSGLATSEELRIIEAAWREPLAEAEAALEAAASGEEPFPPSAAARGWSADSPAASADERVKVRAARLRLVTDPRLGKSTPQWVKDLARTPV